MSCIVCTAVINVYRAGWDHGNHSLIWLKGKYISGAVRLGCEASQSSRICFLPSGKIFIFLPHRMLLLLKSAFSNVFPASFNLVRLTSLVLYINLLVLSHLCSLRGPLLMLVRTDSPGCSCLSLYCRHSSTCCVQIVIPVDVFLGHIRTPSIPV